MPASTWSTTDNTNVTLSSGNLTATLSASNGYVRGKDPKRAGKYYFESTCGAYTANSTAIGLGTGFAAGNNTQNVCLVKPGSVNVNNVDQGIALGTLVTGNVVCIAVDLDARRIWFRVGAAGNWNANAGNNPATGVGGVSFSVLGAGPAFDFYPMFSSLVSGEAETANFGGSAFTGTVPSGFTSGWDDSVAVVTNMLATQAAVEQFAPGAPSMQLTQAAIEQFASGLPVVQLTQASVEMWAAVALAPAVVARKQAWIMA